MSCPAETYHGVTQQVFDCLKRRLESYGIRVPAGSSGTIAGHGASGQFTWNEGEGTLVITITQKPEWASCADITRTIGGAVRGCGGS